MRGAHSDKQTKVIDSVDGNRTVTAQHVSAQNEQVAQSYNIELNSISIAVSILIFLFGLLWNSHVDRKKRAQFIEDDYKKQRQTRKHYLIALREEISINVVALERLLKFSENPENLNKIENFINAKDGNRPSVTYAYFDTLYSTRTEVLQDLEENIINRIVDFYSKLSELKADVDGLDSNTAAIISAPGRIQAVRLVVEEAKLAKLQGNDLRTLLTVVISK